MKSRYFMALTLLSVTLLSACSFGEGDVTDDIEMFDDVEDELTDGSSAGEDVLYAFDFEDVCNGVAMPEAAEYSDEAGIHKLLHFSREDETESFYQSSFTLPEAWQVSYEEDAALTEIVVCTTVVPGEKDQACEYDIEGETYIAETYSAEQEVEIYVAQTGELLDSTTLEMDAPTCPSFRFFTETTEAEYPMFDELLTDYVKPFAQK